MEANSLTDQLRRLVAGDHRSYTRLARESGLHIQQVSRFAKGERGLAAENLDALAATIGARVVVDAPATEA